ncbi:MAG: ABC transporter substrate-binding protein [Anaerolineae bacterium]|jgi:peptide/nickel transport system substrate-binding protein|nr:ABC transporter substrate-binding protein [Chloroflexota bacterium]
MDLNKHTRRDFLRLAGLSTAGVIVAACAPATPAPTGEATAAPTAEQAAAPTATTAAEPTMAPTAEQAAEATAAPEAEPMGKYKESPMLADMVAAGDLPPVEERLPEEPLVIEPYEAIGEYGGTLTVGILSASFRGGDIRSIIGNPYGLRINKDATGYVPNILKDAVMSDDFLSCTCTMRKGLKFSDGQPLTSANIQWWYDNVLLNTDLTPSVSKMFRPGGEVMELEIIDDYTYRFIFKYPNPRFAILSMAHQSGFGDNNGFVPSHYLEQFHINFNDKANDEAKAAGFDFWYQNYGRANDRQFSIERPRIEPFIPARETPQMLFLERNPYYFIVDTEGNQLPYIDKLNADVAADLSIHDAKVVGGTYDFAAMQLRILSYATYAEGATNADAQMYLWQTGKGSEVVYNVNMNWTDDEWREVFSDDRFRQALSLAINRADINNVIYFGNASETQFTVIPSSTQYKAEFAQAYAEFDLDKANALLDEMGLEWNAAKTHRTWPKSKTEIVIPWDLVETETPKGPITELITEYWKTIGIDIQWKSVTRTLLTQKVLANEEPMSLWHGDETTDILLMRAPKFFSPGTYDENCWAVLWAQWYSSQGESGEEPPQMIKDLFEWNDKYNETFDPIYAQQTLASQAEHIWTVGAIGNAPHPLFVRNSLKNVNPTGGYWTWDTLWTYPEYPEQWYIAQS